MLIRVHVEDTKWWEHKIQNATNIGSAPMPACHGFKKKKITYSISDYKFTIGLERVSSHL